MTESKKKILIVDDEKDLTEVLSFGFQDLEVFVAFDGQEGLETARRVKPDVIVSDINMPKMSGLEMLEALNATGLRIPVIFATGFLDTQKIRTAWKLGAFDFFEKPIDLELLKSIVKKALVFGVSVQESPKENSAPNTSDPVVTLQLQIKQSLLSTLKNRAQSDGKTLQEYIESQLSALL